MSQVEKLRILAADGAESEALVVTRERGQPVEAVVLCTPAMAVPARFYEPLARELASRGLGVVVSELRGVGSSSVRPRRGVDFGYHELALRDLPAVLEATRSVFPQAPLFLLGHSLGGQVSALYASAHPEAARGLILVASGSPYFHAWPFPRNLGVLAFSQVLRGVSAVMGYLPGRRLGFAGTEARRLIREWASLAVRGRFQVAGSPHDFEALLPQLSLPLLALSFDDDRLAPRYAVEHLASKMPRASVTHRHLLPREVGVPSLNHFQWAKHPAPVADVITEWVRSQISTLP